MKSFLLAIQFLTIMPLKIKEVSYKNLSNSLIYFPLAGFFIGAVLVGIYNLRSLIQIPAISLNIILVVSLIVLTRGIHLDGFADTCDALFSMKDKEEMLKIMRDPQIGAIGALGMTCIILLKIALLCSITVPSLKMSALLLMGTLSRWSCVLAVFVYPYARQDGKAKVFYKGIRPRIFIFSTLIAVGCIYLSWDFIKGLIVLGVIIITSHIFLRTVKIKLGGITGDTLGALTEISEIVTLLSVSLLKGVVYV